jgi:hypothetical protein
LGLLFQHLYLIARTTGRRINEHQDRESQRPEKPDDCHILTGRWRMPATDFLPQSEPAYSQAGIIYLLLDPPFHHYSDQFDFSR